MQKIFFIKYKVLLDTYYIYGKITMLICGRTTSRKNYQIMGLDMYLYLRKSEYHSNCSWRNNEEEKKLAKYPKELASFEQEISHHNFASVYINTDYQIGYWRKANAIHQWIVDNCAEGVDNCQDVLVSNEKADRLLELCKLVLEDHSQASEELPTQSGFFFGSQEYGDWYFEDLEYTKDLLTKVLDFLKTKEGEDYRIVYCASW